MAPPAAEQKVAAIFSVTYITPPNTESESRSRLPYRVVHVALDPERPALLQPPHYQAHQPVRYRGSGGSASPPRAGATTRAPPGWSPGRTSAGSAARSARPTS